MKFQYIMAFLMLYVLPGAAIKPEIRSSFKPVRWVVEKSSTLRVEGETNVNHFTCNIDRYVENDTIICLVGQANPIKLIGALQLDVLSFDCHSGLITKDFRKTIKSEKYPNLVIRFLSLESMPDLQNKAQWVKGWVEVELAGVVKKFELNYSFSKEPLGNIKLNGAHRFSFSDFNLSPPKKFGGMIKINDAFDVKFQLMLQPLQ